MTGAVWEAMLEAEAYKHWTSAFCEGSFCRGSWDEGEKIEFLWPGGDGMSAVIAENRPRALQRLKPLCEGGHRASSGS